MFSGDIFNPAINHDNRIYFKSPNGNGYQYKIYNPNNQSTRLPYNTSQYYEKGTQPYYQNLKGLNSSVYQRDNIIGKTVFTEHGRPILLKKESNVKIPQVKYESEVPVKLNWARCDYYDIDDKYMKQQTDNSLKKMNIPMEKDLKPEYRNNIINNQTNLIENLHTMSRETINNIPIKTSINSYPNVVNRTISTNNLVEHFQTVTENFAFGLNSKKQQNNDVDVLYREMIRAHSKGISYYLNSNPKYSKWKKNWEILEKNLNKTNLLVERLPENDKDIAYTKNKGEVIRFRWRDKNKYLSKNVFMYVILHELTHQVFEDNFIGHDEPFPTMLCIMVVAGLELCLFDLSKIPSSTIYSNGQEIGSKESLRNQLYIGVSLLEKENPESKEYYRKLRNFIDLQ